MMKLPGFIFSSHDFYLHVYCFYLFRVCVCVCKELLLKDEECERLSKIRDQLGQELEELTASLFQVGPLPVHPLLPVSCFLLPFPPQIAARLKPNRQNLNDLSVVAAGC